MITDNKDVRRSEAGIERQLRHACEHIVPEFGHFADADMPEYAGVLFAPEICQRLVRFDGNDYSVPTAYAHHPITVVGGLDEVRLVCRDHLVARHPRHWGKEHVTFDPSIPRSVTR